MSEDNGNKHRQILKSREDHTPVFLVPAVDTSDSFVLEKDAKCSWAGDGGTITKEKLRERIEPRLTALCQSEYLSLLLGSGLTHAVHFVEAGGWLHPRDRRAERKGRMTLSGSRFRAAEPDLTKLFEQVHAVQPQLPGFQRGWVWGENHIRSPIGKGGLAWPS